MRGVCHWELVLIQDFKYRQIFCTNRMRSVNTESSCREQIHMLLVSVLRIDFFLMIRLKNYGNLQGSKEHDKCGWGIQTFVFILGDKLLIDILRCCEKNLEKINYLTWKVHWELFDSWCVLLASSGMSLRVLLVCEKTLIPLLFYSLRHSLMNWSVNPIIWEKF